MIFAQLLDWTADRLYSFLRWVEGDPEEVEDPAKAFHRTFKLYFPAYLAVYIVLFGLLAIDMIGYWSVPRQAYGLAFDVVGAVVLAKGLLQSPAGIISDTSTYAVGFGNAPQAGYIPGSKKAIDAFSGTVFLLTGFSIQGLAVMSVI